jgi:BON domain
MNSKSMLVGAGVGATLAYLFDPGRGARRRAQVRDKFVWGSRKTRDGLDATARDLANRTRGTAAAIRGRLTREHVDDERLVDRVRARLGRACSHPRAIDVTARDGEVTLQGPILASEVSHVVVATTAVRGVRAVVNNLQAHESAVGIPALQGDGRVLGPSLDILQRHWAPATQALVAAAGLAATGMCLAAYSRR